MATTWQWGQIPDWNTLSAADRALYGGSPTDGTYGYGLEQRLRRLQPFLDRGLATQVPQEVMAQLQWNLAQNPSGFLSAGFTDAGETQTVDPGLAIGKYEIDPDGTFNYDLGGKTWGQEHNAVYDSQGRLVDIGSGDSTALGLAKFILASVGAYGAVSGLAGLAGGGAAAGGAGGMTAAEQAAMMAANGMSDAEIIAALGAEGATSAGLMGVGGGTAAGGGAAAGGGLLGGAKSVVDALGGAKGLVTGLGAVAGALDSKDKEATSSRDPWAPMQPYLLGLAEDGRGLYNQLKAQPFSPAQQTAYNNVGGLLDVLNLNAGGLLQGMQANATGQNQFVRGQPRQLIGSAPIDGMAFQPGLLGNFGTRRG